MRKFDIFNGKIVKNWYFLEFYWAVGRPRAGLLKTRPGPGRPPEIAALQGPAQTPRAGPGPGRAAKMGGPGSPVQNEKYFYIYADS